MSDARLEQDLLEFWILHASDRGWDGCYISLQVMNSLPNFSVSQNACYLNKHSVVRNHGTQRLITVDERSYTITRGSCTVLRTRMTKCPHAINSFPYNTNHPILSLSQSSSHNLTLHLLPPPHTPTPCTSPFLTYNTPLDMSLKVILSRKHGVGRATLRILTGVNCIS
jgi:hypothetical protein